MYVKAEKLPLCLWEVWPAARHAPTEAPLTKHNPQSPSNIQSTGGKQISSFRGTRSFSDSSRSAKSKSVTDEELSTAGQLGLLRGRS